MPGVFFNISSMMNQNSLRLHNRVLTEATERLATGNRINNAKDDPFRNHESKNVDNEINCLGKAKQNSSDGAAFLQIAEGTCGEIQNILQRIRELSVQGSNDTLSSSERHYLNIEANDLLKEITRIADGTTFNTKQVFGNKEDSFSDENRPLTEDKENGIEAWSPFSGGKDIRMGVLHIGTGTSKADEVKVSIPEISAKSLGLDSLSLTYQAGATKAIDDLDSALSSIETIRSYMGSVVNRMDTQVENLENTDINLNDYNSKIRDADIAEETTRLATAQIRQQAAISILAQGNSKVNRVLEILGG